MIPDLAAAATTTATAMLSTAVVAVATTRLALGQVFRFARTIKRASHLMRINEITNQQRAHETKTEIGAATWALKGSIAVGWVMLNFYYDTMHAQGER